MKKKRWLISEPPEECINQLLQQLRISRNTAKLLCNRNIFTYEDAERFFCPTLDRLYDPFYIHDMDAATSRLIQAVDQKEKIMIYGDYDVDGTTATAMLFTFLETQNANVIYYINNREIEGYGLSMLGVAFAKEADIKLVITVDCGITGFEQAVAFAEHGIDLIICDHHEPKNELPTALAILNTKKANCSYPFKELSGCGIAFKLIDAVLKKRPEPNHTSRRYLDFVALATAADIVDLSDENRILMSEGLFVMKHESERPFIRAVAEVSQTNLHALTVTDVVFKFAPRINAAGRLEHAKASIALMLSKTYEEAIVHAKKLSTLNSERQRIQKEIVTEAEYSAQCLIPTFPSSIVVYKDSWHVGIVGIVASRLVEVFYLPSVVLTEHNGVIKGSARSVKGVDLFYAMTLCKEHLIQFGGHEMAAGLTLHIDQLEAFRKKFDSVCNELLGDMNRFPCIDIDAEISLEDITPNFLKILKRFEPCGPKNRHPVFLTKNVSVFSEPRTMKDEHLKFQVQDSAKRVFDVIGFGFAENHFTALTKTRKADIVYCLEENEWNGRASVQLRLKDINIV